MRQKKKGEKERGKRAGHVVAIRTLKNRLVRPYLQRESSPQLAGETEVVRVASLYAEPLRVQREKAQGGGGVVLVRLPVWLQLQNQVGVVGGVSVDSFFVVEPGVEALRAVDRVSPDRGIVWIFNIVCVVTINREAL